MTIATMQQWQLPAPDRSTLRLAVVPRPTPGPGEVLVQVEAVSLNYRDLMLLENRYGAAPTLPFTPGSDMAGTVIEVGPGVTRWRGGERVMSTFVAGWIDGIAPPTARALGSPGPGMLATHVVLDAEWLVAAPAHLDAAAASTLPCAALTAWFSWGDGSLRAGQSVLIHGTGGVALFGLQFARMFGASAIVVSGDAAKRERVLALGAAYALDRNADWPAQVMALTGDRGVDHVLETVGGANLGRSLQALALEGRIAFIGVLDGAALGGSGYDLIRRRATIRGISVGHRRALEDMVRAIDLNRLQPVIAAEYALTELPAAVDHLARGPFGKIVLRA